MLDLDRSTLRETKIFSEYAARGGPVADHPERSGASEHRNKLRLAGEGANPARNWSVKRPLESGLARPCKWRQCVWLRYDERNLLFAPPNHADAHQPCREQSEWGRNRNRSDSERCWLTNTAIDQSGLTSGSAEDVEGEERRNMPPSARMARLRISAPPSANRVPIFFLVLTPVPLCKLILSHGHLLLNEHFLTKLDSSQRMLRPFDAH